MKCMRASKLKGVLDFWILPYESPFSRKIFDSITLLKEEVERCKNLDFFIIHPCSRFKICWDLAAVIVLAVNMIVLPVQQAFFHPYTLKIGWLLFNLVTTVFYLIDILVNFYSGAVMSDKICMSRSFLMLRYLKGWFLIDFLGAVPFDFILKILARYEGDHAMAAVARSAGILKMLRMPSLIRQVTIYQDVFFNTAHRVHVKLINVLLSMLLLAHLNACLLYFVPMIQGFPRTSWVAKNNVQDLAWYEQYIWSFFGAICIMIGIGFGKSEPKEIPEVIVTCFVVISGAVGYGLLLANGTALVQTLNYSRTSHEQIMSEVKQYSRYKKLPLSLQKRLRDYFENRFKGQFFDEDRIISQLSEVLREDVLRHNCRALVCKVPFFADAEPHVVADVVSRLRSEFYQPGDVIIASGTVGSRMFFLQSGNVLVRLKDGTVVAQLKDGSYFGEMCLLSQETRNASVVAEAYCMLYSLATENFNEILQKYPFLRQSMERIARLRSIQNQVTQAERSGIEIHRF
ncbi:potassium/sodium hyperpolarization-activated cyclic nucleotide-gated channel 4-like [Galendromus occidentalis]|uniref:Potassium/sodium hyperpolarization-activated cyclic nucleotide-gated channel 4-like n=1 Tax=Galendromus occidentalis TaxID=34638 RepID=A0AAJ6QWA0_9ACAR|nr:potassium/sodium hyperpolarization-activated cyclic nucleotide-gated channel 4-like [Galendromus occidentalis]